MSLPSQPTLAIACARIHQTSSAASGCTEVPTALTASASWQCNSSRTPPDARPIYQGRNMEKAHRGMGLSARDWDRAFNFFRLAVWAHVKDEATRVEFLALIGKTHGAIVDYQSRHYGCSQPKD
jgi:hypothetical protein